MKNNLLLKSLLVLSFIACLYINYLSNALPLNGFTAGELSDLYPNQFTPAGFTFAVWGIIYLSAILAVVALTIASDKDISKKWYYAFITINLLNLSWLLAWHYQYLGLSLLVMAGLLVSLLYLYIDLRNPTAPTSFAQKALKIMTSLYLSWISVAIIANFTSILVKNNILTGNISQEALIASIMIIIALGICYWLTKKYSDFIHPLVLAWASYGVYSKMSAMSIPENSAIVYTSMFVIGFSLFISIRNARTVMQQY
jgi:uncharacterized membrane protein YhaH (DUF805 family)